MQYFGFDRPSFAFKTYGFGSSEFSPLDLFTGGKQGVWYDPSDKSTLFQDVTGTIPVTTHGDPVALMRDKSGNSNHAVQTVSTARPIYKTDGILHWLAFDGVDDNLKFQAGGPLTSVLVGFKGESSGNLYAYLIDFRPIFNGWVYNTLFDGVTKKYPDSVVNTESFSGVLQFNINNPSEKTSHSITVFSRYADANRHLKGRFYGFVATEQVVTLVNNKPLYMYLENKSGVTL